MSGWNTWNQDPTANFQQPEGWLERMSRIKRLKAQDQEDQLRRMQITEMQRQQQEASAMRQAQTQASQMPGEVTNPSSGPTIGGVSLIGGGKVYGPPGTASPQQQNEGMLAQLAKGPAAYRIPEIRAQQQQAQEAQKEKQFQHTKESLGLAAQVTDQLTKLAVPVYLAESQGASPEEVAAIYQRQKQAAAPLLAQASQAGLSVPPLPDQYVPGFGQQAVQQGMSAAEAIKQHQFGIEQAGKTVQLGEGPNGQPAGVYGHDPNTGQPTKFLAKLPKTAPGMTVNLNGKAPLSPGADVQTIDQAKQPHLFKIAQDLAYGKLTMQQFRSLYAYSRDTKGKQSLYATAQELNPNFNPAAFEMGQTFAKNPKVQQQLASLDNVIKAAPDLLKASAEAERSGIPAINGIILKGGIAFGGKKYSNFKTAQIAFADELSGALGYGSATDMSREMGFNMTDPNLTPAQFNSSVSDIVIPFVQRKRDTLLHQMGTYGEPGMNPAAGSSTSSVTHRYNPATGKIEEVKQ